MKEGRILGDEDWLSLWNDEKTEWQLNRFHEYLPQFFPAIRQSFKDKKIRVLVPLCGKTLDLIYFRNILNCNVFGVEICEKACKQFFIENAIAFEEMDHISHFKIYASVDGTITIYCGDFFAFPEDQSFNFAWDRAALTAINVRDQVRYAEKVTRLLNPNSYLLLATLDYNSAYRSGPPHNISSEKVEELYGANFHISLLKERGNHSYVNRAYLLTHK